MIDLLTHNERGHMSADTQIGLLEVIELARRGDAEATKTLCEILGRYLKGRIGSILRKDGVNRQDTDDALHDTVIRAGAQIGQLREAQSVFAWLPSLNNLGKVANRGALGSARSSASLSTTYLPTCVSSANSVCRLDDRNPTTSYLMEMNYPALVRMAERELRADRLRRTLEPCEVVNEMYLRIMNHGEQTWDSPRHFLGTASFVMKHVLIDEARARNAQKRGGGRVYVRREENL